MTASRGRFWVDGHCHLDLLPPAEIPAVLARARAAGVAQLILAGVDPAGWEAQRGLAAAHSGLFRTAGLHPWAAVARAAGVSADTSPLDADLEALTSTLMQAPRPVAIGELGLDHLRTPMAGRVVEEAAFRAQLALARALDLPVVLHVVQAHGRALEILRADGLPRRGGVVHGFSGSAEVALAYVRLGLHVGIGFVVHRTHAKKVKAAVAALPLGRIILETDAPAEAPPGAEGASEPAHLVGIAEAVAALRGAQAEALLDASSENARALYQLPRSSHPPVAT